jgi:hypothetical protein
LRNKEAEVAGKVKVAADNTRVVAAVNVKVEVAGNAKVAPRLRLAAGTSPIAAPLRTEAQLNRSEATTVAVRAATAPAAVALVATKGKRVHRIATNQAIPKPRTFIPKVIVGSVMTGAATMLVTIRITYGNMDASAAKLAATTFIGSKAEAATVSGSAAFTGTSRRTTTTTLAIGCGTPTTSCCMTIQITLAGISLITLDSELMPTSSISARRRCLARRCLPAPGSHHPTRQMRVGFFVALEEYACDDRDLFIFAR